MTEPTLIPLAGFRRYSANETLERATAAYGDLRRRRSVRDFSERPVAREVIEQCLLAAGTAPSGANLQPWHFVVIADPALKARIRQAAEEEERDFYQRRAPQEWKDALAQIATFK